MKSSFDDIIAVAGAPTFYDQNGTPRYGSFDPKAYAYADSVILAKIACQDCGKHFLVSMQDELYEKWDMTEWKRDVPHYGDPPVYCGDNCSAGYSMNSVMLEVLEFWKYDDGIEWKDGHGRPVRVGEWKRVPELEGEVHSPWCDSNVYRIEYRGQKSEAPK